MVELKNPEHRRGIHTAYVGDTDTGRDDSGAAKRTMTATFLRGKPKGVDPATARALKDAGILK